MVWLLNHFKILHIYKSRLACKSSGQLPVVPFAGGPVQWPYIYSYHLPKPPTALMESPNRSDGFTTNVGSHANGFGGLPAARYAIEIGPHHSHTNTLKRGVTNLNHCL